MMKQIEVLTRMECPDCGGTGLRIANETFEKVTRRACECNTSDSLAGVGYILDWHYIDVPEAA